MAEILKNKQWDLAPIFADKFTEHLRYYFYVGGMPEVVNDFVTNHDWNNVKKKQEEILTTYENDFSKHAPYEIVPRLNMVWQNIPSQLAKENKKFIYNMIKEGARAKDFELAIQWLNGRG